MTPKPGATFDRPNGSTNGRKALSRALDGTLWTVTGSTCPSATGALVSGLVDFAGSSAGPAAGGGPLMYLPFGRDAVSFAYVATSLPNDPATGLPRNPVATLSRAQLTSLFSQTTGSRTVNNAQGLPVEIVPCSLQTGSGTYSAWNTAVNVSASQMAAATTQCTPATPTFSGLQENDGLALKAKADNPAFVGRQVVVGFSAANFIAQSNGVAASRLPVGGGIDLGSIVNASGTSLGKPYAGAVPNLRPCGPGAGCMADFYADPVFGRTVYNVVPAAKITGPANTDFKTLFANTTSNAAGTPAICTATTKATISAFGFVTLPDASAIQTLPPTTGFCGESSLTGPAIAGNGTL